MRNYGDGKITFSLEDYQDTQIMKKLNVLGWKHQKMGEHESARNIAETSLAISIPIQRHTDISMNLWNIDREAARGLLKAAMDAIAAEDRAVKVAFAAYRDR